MRDISDILVSLAMRVPLLVVAVVGLVMAMSRRDKYPKASMYVILASIGLLVEMVVSTAFYMLIPKTDIRGENLMYVYRVSNCFFNIVSAGLTGLLIAAAFADRHDPNGRPARPNRWDRGPIDEPTVLEEEPRGDRGQMPPSTGFRDRPER